MKIHFRAMTLCALAIFMAFAMIMLGHKHNAALRRQQHHSWSPDVTMLAAQAFIDYLSTK